ncbi:MAG: hypothetical protein WC352_03330 [Candidatus Omnitrophota bacterium]|jgi:hypothetical protein
MKKLTCIIVILVAVCFAFQTAAFAAAQDINKKSAAAAQVNQGQAKKEVAKAVPAVPAVPAEVKPAIPATPARSVVPAVPAVVQKKAAVNVPAGNVSKTVSAMAVKPTGPAVPAKPALPAVPGMRSAVPATPAVSAKPVVRDLMPSVAKSPTVVTPKIPASGQAAAKTVAQTAKTGGAKVAAVQAQVAEAKK